MARRAGPGEAGRSALSQVEPVYDRGELRNYRETAAGREEGGDTELRSLLESLKSSDVISVKHKKSVPSRGPEPPPRAPDPPANLTGERRYSKSPPKPRPPASTKPAFSPYVTAGRAGADLLTGQVTARRLFAADTQPRPTPAPTPAPPPSKLDFTSRMMESFSDLGLELGPARLVTKVHSLPELKTESLLVGSRKAIHSRSPFGGYVPSQLESSGPAKPRFQVRTDWKAKYLK